jgi:hypothetical protein
MSNRDSVVVLNLRLKRRTHRFAARLPSLRHLFLGIKARNETLIDAGLLPMFHSGSNIQAQKKNDLQVKYLCQSVLVTVIDSESFLLNVREFRAEASFQA